MRSELFTTTLLRAGELSGINRPMSITIGSSLRYPIQNINQKAPKLSKDNLEFIPQIEKVGNQQYLSLKSIGDKAEISSGHYILKTESDSSILALNYDRVESSVNSIKMADLVEK